MDKKSILIFLLIFALGAFFRFYLITEIPLGLYPDEAMNGNNALEAIATGNWKIFYPENNGREGLFINIQALSIWFFGNEPWALRVVSAIFGTLTVWGVYLLTKELFGNHEKQRNHNSKFLIPDSTIIALLSSFFLATSFWHINFSRIGFRAIMVPFLAVFGIYFLLKGLRSASYSSSEDSTAVESESRSYNKVRFSTSSNNIIYLTLAGIFIGLGFHTYIAFRFMPFVIAVPIVWYLWDWWKKKNPSPAQPPPPEEGEARRGWLPPCTPCAIILFLFITFVIALPTGYYFLQNPADFLGRGGQVSIFASESPAFEFLKSNLATLGMFFYQGDCNWRHNYACQPELHPIVAFFFIIGIIQIVWVFIKKPYTLYPIPYTLLAAWLFFMSLPATLTKEGLPHALRTIGMVPPVMILSGLGAYIFIQKVLDLLEKAKIKWPEIKNRAERLQREFVFLVIFVILFLPIFTYRDYILRWASHPETYFSFATDMWHAGEFLDRLPDDTYKYVIVNLSGTEVRGIPMPSQTIMFATDTFREERQNARNIYYLLPQEIDEKINPPAGTRVIIMPLNGDDDLIKQKIREKFPDYEFKAPSDFVIFSNYYKF